MKPYELPLYHRAAPPIATTNEVDALVSAGAVVAIGVSGGKDSTACAFATVAHLDRVNHRGPRVLIHSDLGATEWPQSLPWCQKLADRLGLELFVVRRAKGDMMERWEQRWADNVARYASLRCVKLILPWSTPAMRFCTSELKTGVICRELTIRYPGHSILSVSGIRRQESRDRANAPISARQPLLSKVTRRTHGLDWHPIADWSLDDVLSLHTERRFPLHPAYTEWGVGRVSCMDCMMQSDRDARAASTFPGILALRRRVVALEIKSTFAFQGDRWRGDVAPDLLTDTEREQLARAKSKAAAREALEALIPNDLLYTKGWPRSIPTRDSAELLCGVRRQVAQIIGIEVDYTEPRRLIDRYIELWTEQHRRAS